MTDLNSFFTDKGAKECSSKDECINLIATGLYEHTYFTEQHRYPVCEQPHGKVGIRVEGFALADMVSDFECNVEYSIFIGEREYKTNRILSLCTAYHPSYAYLSLNQPNMLTEIVFSRKNHYFSTDIRRTIAGRMNQDGIIDGGIVYTYGMAAAECLS